MGGRNITLHYPYEKFIFFCLVNQIDYSRKKADFGVILEEKKRKLKHTKMLLYGKDMKNLMEFWDENILKI